MHFGFRFRKFHTFHLSVCQLTVQFAPISCGQRRILGQFDLNNNVPAIGGQGFFSATRPHLAVIWANVPAGEDADQYATKTSVLVTVQQESDPVQVKWAIYILS